MNIYTSPVFLQEASNINRTPVEPVSEIQLRFNAKNQSVELSCEGEIEVVYIQNGVAKKDTYTDLSSTEVYFGCDANTDVVITGQVTEIDLSSKKNLVYAKIQNTALTQLSCNYCNALISLDLSKNTALTQLECSDCNALISLDLSKNTALTQLSCSYCYALTSLDLSKNTALTQLECSDCSKIEEIYAVAANSDVATAIAGLISNAEAEDGTLYANSADTYYSTIETAANAKGWTIAPLPEAA